MAKAEDARAPQWRVSVTSGGLILSPRDLPSTGGSLPWEDYQSERFALGKSTVLEKRIHAVTRRKVEQNTGRPYYQGRLSRDGFGRVTLEKFRARHANTGYELEASTVWPVAVWTELLPDIQAVAAGGTPKARPVQWSPDPTRRWYQVFEVGGQTVRVPSITRTFHPGAAVASAEGEEYGMIRDSWRFCRVERASADPADGWAIRSFSADPLSDGRLLLKVDSDPRPFALQEDGWASVLAAGLADLLRCGQ